MKKKERIKNEVVKDIRDIKQILRSDVSAAIIASFGFIIALVWRDAIQSAIGHFLDNAGLKENVYIYQIISAIIVTVLVLFIMVTVIRLREEKQKKRIERVVAEKIEDSKKN